MRITRALATLAIAVILAACGSQGDNNVFLDNQGNRRCAYVSETTQDAFCGKSGVAKPEWVSPPEGTIYDASDGFTVEELALGKLLSGWPQRKRPDDADKKKVEIWQRNNPDFAARYAAANSPPPSAAATP